MCKFLLSSFGVEGIAQICEIQGDLAGAIAAQEELIELTRNEWETTGGEELDYHYREIQRLKEKMKH